MFERIAFTTVDDVMITWASHDLQCLLVAVRVTSVLVIESLSISVGFGVLRFLRLEDRVAEENNGLIAG